MVTNHYTLHTACQHCLEKALGEEVSDSPSRCHHRPNCIDFAVLKCTAEAARREKGNLNMLLTQGKKTVNIYRLGIYKVSNLKRLPLTSVHVRSSQLITAHIYRPEQLHSLVAANWSQGFTLHVLLFSSIYTGARQKDTRDLQMIITD